jgi:hypothetical protein
MNAQATLATTPAKPSFGSVLKAGIIGGITAAGLNIIVLLLAGVFGISLNVMAGPPPNQQAMTLTAVPVILFSFVPAIIGALVFFLLTRITAKAATIFIVIAVVIVLLSLLPIFGQPLSAGGVIALVLMHFIAGGVVTYWLTQRSR